MRELVTQRPRGFGFITFGTEKDRDWAIEEMHESRISGRVVTVSKARPFERPRGDRSPHRFDNSDRRAGYFRREGGLASDFPRRYHQDYHDRDNGQRPYYDRHRSYDQPMQGRRYGRDGRGSDDQHSSNPPYNSNHFDNRHVHVLQGHALLFICCRDDRGDYRGDYEGRCAIMHCKRI